MIYLTEGLGSCRTQEMSAELQLGLQEPVPSASYFPKSSWKMAEIELLIFHRHVFHDTRYYCRTAGTASTTHVMDLSKKVFF